MLLSLNDVMYQALSYDFSFIKLTFGAMAAAVLFVGVLINTSERHLPRFLVNAYRYGKMVNKNASVVVKTVPKSWFKHFYVLGIAWTCIITLILTKVYLTGHRPPALLISLLDATASSKRTSSGTAVASLLAMILLLSHCFVRLIETSLISVFSPSRMNIVHYAFGIIHYLGTPLAIVAEAPGFSANEEFVFSWNDLEWVELIAVLIFCLASYEQTKSSIILANLRKTKGVVYTYQHMMPRGRLFEVVSSPHIMAEIVIYIALTIILCSNQTWFLVFLWVFANQCQVAWMNHKWYQEKFPNYPKVRKALIPYLL